MGNLTIRNLDDRVIESLKAQAKANERSLEGEIRHLLTQRADRRGRIASFRERTRRLVAATGARRGPTAWICCATTGCDEAMMQYLVVVHPDRSGGPIGVSVPDLPGRTTIADTRPAALDAARDAIAGWDRDSIRARPAAPEPSMCVDPGGGRVALVTVPDGVPA